MPMYRTLLEEEITHLNDDNDTSEQVKELIDAIENAEDNAEEVAAAQAAEFGEDDVPVADAADVMEETFMAIAESEMIWNEIMQEAGLKELRESEVYTESLDDIKAWFKKAKDRIVAFFKKVWQVIQRWASNVFAMLHTNKSFADKYANRMADGYKEYIKSDTKKLKGYPFTGFTGNKDQFDYIATASKNLQKNIKSMIDEVKANASELGDITIDAADEITKAFYDGSKINPDDMDMTKGRERLDGLLRWNDKDKGNDDPDELDRGMDVATITKVLKDGSAIKKSTKKAMSEAKTAFKDAIKSVDALEKRVDNIFKDNKEAANGVMACCVRINKALNVGQNGIQVMRASIMSNLNKYIHQCRRFGNYYVTLANKANPKMKGFQKESAFLGGLNLI